VDEAKCVIALTEIAQEAVCATGLTATEWVVVAVHTPRAGGVLPSRQRRESAELKPCNSMTAGESVGGGGRKCFVTKDIEITGYS
jgi:hypothetical protein